MARPTKADSIYLIALHKNGGHMYAVFGSAGDVTAYHRDGRVLLRRRSTGGGYVGSEAQEVSWNLSKR